MSDTLQLQMHFVEQKLHLIQTSPRFVFMVYMIIDLVMA